jgi:hypothetical protein
MSVLFVCLFVGWLVASTLNEKKCKVIIKMKVEQKAIKKISFDKNKRHQLLFS